MLFPIHTLIHILAYNVIALVRPLLGLHGGLFVFLTLTRSRPVSVRFRLHLGP